MKEIKHYPEMPYQNKILSFEELSKTIKTEQEKGRSVVLTTGIYDLVHFKHAESLLCISTFGDVLVVGVPGDEQVKDVAREGRQQKDTEGPIIEYNRRVKLLSHFDYVDFVFMKEQSKRELIEILSPDVLVQSITSSVGVVKEVVDLKNIFNFSEIDGNLRLFNNGKKCDIYFISDIVDSSFFIVPNTEAINAAKEWYQTKFDEENFHGSMIKQRIINRYARKK